MKQFELILHRRDTTGKFLSMDKIESDNLVQLVCQFNLIIITMQRQIVGEKIDDDIPF